MNKFLLIFILIFNYSAYANKPKIAVIFNPEGKYHHLRSAILRGVKLFFKNRKDISVEYLEYGDTLSQQSKAAQYVVKNKIRFIIGHNFSSMSLAFLKSLPANYNMTYITPLATSTKLLSVNKGVFILWPENKNQILAIQRFILSKSGAPKKVGIIINQSETYSHEMSSLFKKYSENLGYPKISEFSFIKNKFDVKKVVEFIQKGHFDLIFAPLYSYDLMKIYKEVLEEIPSKQRPLFISGDTVGRAEIIYSKFGPLAASLGSKFYFTNGWDKKITTSENKLFLDKFKRFYRELPTAGAAGGYDAAKMLYEGLDQSINKNPEEVNKYLEKYSGKISVGEVLMDKNRILSRKVGLFSLSPKGFIFDGLY